MKAMPVFPAAGLPAWLAVRAVMMATQADIPALENINSGCLSKRLTKYKPQSAAHIKVGVCKALSSIHVGELVIPAVFAVHGK